MITEERIQKLPEWIKRILIFLKKMRAPGKIVYITISILATIWFLVRVIPKPSRATYPCMQIAAPMMSGFVLWIIAVTGAAFAFKKAKHKLLQAKYVAASLFLVLGNCLGFNIYTSDQKQIPLQANLRSGTSQTSLLV